MALRSGFEKRPNCVHIAPLMRLCQVVPPPQGRGRVEAVARALGAGRRPPKVADDRFVAHALVWPACFASFREEAPVLWRGDERLVGRE